MRVMALDYGDATVGVAVSDSLFLTAQGIEIIRREKETHLRPTLRRIGKRLEILFEDEPDQEELAAIGLSRNDSDSRFLMKGHSREGIECYAFADQGLHGRIEAFHGAKLLKNGALYVE